MEMMEGDVSIWTLKQPGLLLNASDRKSSSDEFQKKKKKHFLAQVTKLAQESSYPSGPQTFLLSLEFYSLSGRI